MGSVTVEVDRANILAEAAAVAADAPVPAPIEAAAAPVDGTGAAPVPALDPAAQAADLAPACTLLVYQGAAMFAPNWEVTDDEARSVGGPLALVLAYFVPPGAIDPKWIAVATCAGAVWGVASKRRTEDGWKPLRAPKAAPEKAPTPPVPPVGSNGSGASNVTQLRV